MRLLVEIDLTNADLDAFDAYESAVLPLLVDHGGKLERRLRSLDGVLEVHLLHFSTPHGRQAYLDDPRRAEHAALWRQSRAVAKVIPVEDR